MRLASHGQNPPPPDAKESTIYRLHPDREGTRLIFQIGTSDPDRAVAAARVVAADVAGIDVNAGCPKPFSTHDGMGAVLLRTPDKLVAILEALVKNIVPEFEIGISVKIRLLETPEQTEELVRRLVGTGITGLTVHCRTTPMRPRERAIREQLRMVADVCREAGVACLMNGDVYDRDTAKELIAEYGVDGAMIATAAEKNSSCFRTKADGGMETWDTVVKTYLKLAMEVENRFGNTKFMLSQIVPGKQPVYKLLAQCRSYVAACELMGLEELLEQAAEVDRRIGITVDEPEDAPVAKNKSKRNSSVLTKSQTSPKAASSKRPRTAEREKENSVPDALQLTASF